VDNVTCIKEVTILRVGLLVIHMVYMLVSVVAVLA
jgi:hypothetical protein